MKNIPVFCFFSLLSMLGLSTHAEAQEGDDFKVAVVDVQRVFQEYHKTAQTEKDINEERIRIQKADRELRAQLKVITASNTKETEQAKSLSGEEWNKLSAKIQKQVLERNKFNQERLARYNASNGQLDNDMMQTMVGILGEIQRFITAQAEKSDYDIVFDLSGTSTNQTPPVIGGKGMIDITATVIAELNKDDPALINKDDPALIEKR